MARRTKRTQGNQGIGRPSNQSRNEKTKWQWTSWLNWALGTGAGLIAFYFLMFPEPLITREPATSEADTLNLNFVVSNRSPLFSLHNVESLCLLQSLHNSHGVQVLQSISEDQSPVGELPANADATIDCFKGIRAAGLTDVVRGDVDVVVMYNWFWLKQHCREQRFTLYADGGRKPVWKPKGGPAVGCG